MPDFEPGCVVRVPFPYTDGEARQHRPALVVAQTGPGEGGGLLLWVLMITSAGNRGWVGDVAIPDAAAAGLPAPSIIRCAKIATIDAARAEVRGRVLPATFAEVRSRLRAILTVSQ
ncbi:type II toxin-antitoxin system PemK/MazF family toxin [Rhodobaculum claviforme]|uniref:Growth inhibitor PemK n=1 Tax=Rhodobaculum claviforme TaxID=1549854 RepID=A0A934TJU2_9RHOB|nr:type II toxin-antitoxin system PemK/MazF family toxin [Rhodobaculum claviforme]MBK5926933.1 hypothetical protein [Rhodobaculum claviforme]